MSFNSKETKEEAGTVEDDLGLFTHELITEAQALLRAYALGVRVAVNRLRFL